MPWTFYNSNGQRLSSAATNISVLDIDGATDIGAAIVDADLFIVDDGAGGTNRKTAASRLVTYVGANTDTRSGVAKAWVEFQIDGTRLDSYNITSVTDDGTGYWSPQIGTDFASVNYAAFCTIQSNDLTTAGIIGQLSADSGIKAVGSLRVRAVDDAGGVADPSGSDPSISVVLFGDQ